MSQFICDSAPTECLMPLEDKEGLLPAWLWAAFCSERLSGIGTVSKLPLE